MSEEKQSCLYCLGDPDHKHRPSHSCGNCCSMHGGLTMSDSHAYEWVQDIVTKHNEALSAAEAQLAAVTKEKDQRQYLMDLASKEIKRMWDKQDEWEIENASLREDLEQARNTNRELNRVKQQLEHTLNVESGRKAWYGYFKASNSLYGKEFDRRLNLEAENASLRKIAGHAKHMDNCLVMSVRICTCGLDAALKDRP